MIANLMGYDHSADDTGATSYEGDEARELVGRWQPRHTVNDVISVTDDGGTEDIDILSGTGAVLIESQSCNAWNLCAGLKAAGVDYQHVTVHSEKGHDSFLLEPELYTANIGYVLSEVYKAHAGA